MDFDISKIDGFEWDKGNLDKSKLKHDVDPKESEEIFFHKPLLISQDNAHSRTEKRFQALGQTDLKRQLFAIFAIRHNKIRIISVRDQSRKERKEYIKNEN